MKTKIRNLGIAFILSTLGFGLNASESGLFTAFHAVVEEPLEVESWMLEVDYFETNSAELETMIDIDNESGLELEDWMFKSSNFEVDASVFGNMLVIEEEPILEMETWMTEPGYFETGISELKIMVQADIEPSLELEDWMTEERNFETSAPEFTYTLKTEFEPSLALESWMIDMKFFEAGISDSNESTVVEIAMSNPDFSILVEAVSKAGLVEALSTSGPFTVFAPTNAAFKSLFNQLDISGIKDISTDQLKSILTYHVVSGKLMSTDLSNSSVSTLDDGKIIKIDISNGVKINDSKVTNADISGNNGVIHVIDKVLIPN
jgi:transforming growth factor-beta-induced protein